MWSEHPLIHQAVLAAAIAALLAAVILEDIDLRVGLFGFAGTLAGALATFEATQIAARGERRARKRAAGRLLQEDLLFARTRCLNARRNGRFWAPRLDVRLDGWERYREIASQELETDEWVAVARAFSAMRAVQSKCDGLRPTYGDRPGLGSRSHDLIDKYLERSDPALEMLRRLSGDRPPDEAVVADDDGP